MVAIAPEAVVREWLAEDSAAVDSAVFSEPFHVPYDRLADIDGWVLWLGHPPVPDEVPLLPAPEQMLWDSPANAVAAALLVGADYATRRGASDPVSAAEILRRESPVAIVVPGDLHRSVQRVLRHSDESCLPVAYGDLRDQDALRATIPQFAKRAAAHAIDVGRRHDPVLSFRVAGVSPSMGGNSLSSFIVHNEPERDAVTITGEIGPRVGIEIGVTGDGITVESTAVIEQLAAEIPSFLDGVTGWIEGQSLAIGWTPGHDVSAEILGEAFRTWLKFLTGASCVDVRISFAPPKGRSAVLTDMRARAAAFRQYRAATIAGDPDPLATVAANLAGIEE